MAATIGTMGQVVSWVGTVNAAVLGNLRPSSFTLNQTGQEFDTTGFDSSNNAIASTFLKGLRGWSGTMESFNLAPVSGVVGNVSGTAYTTGVRAWGMTIECDPKDVTPFQATNNWRVVRPGLQRWSGSYEAFVDSATATTPVHGSADGTAEPLAATFTISSGNTFAGSIFTTGASIISRVGDVNLVRYTYRGSGNVTVVGTDAIFDANDGTMPAMAAGSLVLEADDGVTYTGDAFITRAGIAVTQGEVTRVNVGFQGTGACAHAAS